MTTWPGTSIPKSTRNAFGSSKCGACRYQEQLMRKRHGGQLEAS